MYGWIAEPLYLSGALSVATAIAVMHPTQPTIEMSQKMIATMKRAGTGRARKKLTSPITKQTTAMM